MDEQQRKTALKETFNTVSHGYDGGALRFFPKSAEFMTTFLGLKGDEHVLDVACGTGHASLAVAMLLPRGHVTAVDFSAGMLEQARSKTFSRNVSNAEFLERDMTALGFPEKTFDAAVCAFGIFFVEDMDAQLAHISSVVKPGGKILISTFQENYFHPLKEMMAARLMQFGMEMPPQTWKRTAHESGCRELFEKAGLTDISIETKNVGYYLESAEQWWDVIWNAGFRSIVSRLSPAEQERFKREHLNEVEALRTPHGIWLDVGVLYTSGTTREL